MSTAEQRRAAIERAQRKLENAEARKRAIANAQERVKQDMVGGEYSPAPDSIAENLAVSAGREMSRIGSNVKQLYFDVTGNKAMSAAEKRRQAEMDRLAAPAEEEYPISSFIGAALPSFLVPGGKGVQLGAGAVQGALEGDTLGERAKNAAIGAGLAFVGQKAGDEIGQAVNRRFQSLTRNPKAGSLDVLKRAGIGVAPAERTRDPLARLSNNVRGIILNSTNPLEGTQVRKLNTLALKAIGESGDNVSRSTLGKAHSRIGDVFEDAAKNVKTVDVPGALKDPATFAVFRDVADDVASLGVGDSAAGSLKRYFGEVYDAAFNGKAISGQRYNQLRNKIGRISRTAWKRGDEIVAETADATIDVLDDAMALANPDLAKSLSTARGQWKMLRVLRKAVTIDPEGNVNARSMMKAFEKTYPGAEVGKFPSGPAGDFGRTLAAYEEVVRPRITSRTAENLLRIGAPAGSIGLAASGQAPAAIAGLGALGALGFGGGGTGGLLGGGALRSLIPVLGQESLLQQNNQ